jgi:hypothetical protein
MGGQQIDLNHLIPFKKAVICFYAAHKVAHLAITGIIMYIHFKNVAH